MPAQRFPELLVRDQRARSNRSRVGNGEYIRVVPVAGRSSRSDQVRCGGQLAFRNRYFLPEVYGLSLESQKTSTRDKVDAVFCVILGVKK